jgi:hypothetical protein
MNPTVLPDGRAVTSTSDGRPSLRSMPPATPKLLLKWRHEANEVPETECDSRHDYSIRSSTDENYWKIL